MIHINGDTMECDLSDVLPIFNLFIRGGTEITKIFIRDQNMLLTIDEFYSSVKKTLHNLSEIKYLEMIYEGDAVWSEQEYHED